MATITQYRLVDWLRLFGYEVGKILPLQFLLHSDRTILIPSTVFDPILALPYIRRLQAPVQVDRTEPLVTLIDALGYAELRLLDKLNRRRFIYARVGRRDQMMRPRIAAGSIIRIDPTATTPESGGCHSICLVQEAGGLCCCYVERRGGDVILLPEDSSPHLRRCRIGTEVRIVGTIDLELHPCEFPNASFLPPNDRVNCRRLRLTDVAASNTHAGAYARLARERIGLHFREAHRITQQVATHFADNTYEVALGSLSDIETHDGLPRHIPKLISMCVAYGMDFWAYLRAGGAPIDELNDRPIPPEFLPHEPIHQNTMKFVPIPFRLDDVPAVETLIDQIDEIPFFLLPHIPSAVGHEQLSLDDLYVWGKHEPVLHPLLEGALLVIVNRRYHQPPEIRIQHAPANHPLFLIRAPSGRLVVGMCASDRRTVLVHQQGKVRSPTLVFQRKEIDIIGKVVAVLRKIAPDSYPVPSADQSLV